MSLQFSILILVFCLFIGKAHAFQDTLTIHLNPNDSLYPMWITPKLKKPKSFGQKLNDILKETQSIQKQCLDYEEKRWCAFANPNFVMFTFILKF